MKYLSFLRLLARGLEIGGDEQNFGRGRRCGFAASGTRLMPNIPRQPLIGNPEHYDSGRCEAQAKPSTTGAKCGFTLAEILITLSLIGIIAALTIPSLIERNQEKEIVVGLKKAYNTLSNAYTLSIIEYGELSSWCTLTQNPTTWNIVLTKLEKNLNISKHCGNTTSGCFAPGVIYKNFDGTNHFFSDETWLWAKARLADGMGIAVWIRDQTGGTIIVDVNGQKGPNTLGKDTFGFNLKSDGTLTPLDNGVCESIINNTAQGWAREGWYCTAWVLLHEKIPKMKIE